MPMPINTLTGEIPLILASKITKIVNQLWESGEFLSFVTPTTAEDKIPLSKAGMSPTLLPATKIYLRN
jgi:hypothetical protein